MRRRDKRRFESAAKACEAAFHEVAITLRAIVPELRERRCLAGYDPLIRNSKSTDMHSAIGHAVTGWKFNSK